MVSAFVIAGVVAAIAVLLTLSLNSEEDAGRRSAKVLAESVARSLLGTDIESLSAAQIDALLRINDPTQADTGADSPELSGIWVFDPQARVAGRSTDAREEIRREEIVPARQAMADEGGTVIEMLPGDVYAATAAIRALDGSATGAVRIEFTSNRIGTHFDLYRAEYLIGAIIIVVAVILGSWVLAKRLARPIGNMVQVARAVERGRQPEPRIAAALRNTSLTRDEYGELAGVFLDMAREVGAREVQLNALVEERTIALSDKNRALETAQREIRNDLQMAHSVQAALVPADLPEDPRASVAAYMTPALEVGGDFYDAFLTDDGRLAFAIADVSGKGVASALMMAVGRALLRSAANQHPDPSQAVAATNDQLCSMNPKELFITAFFGVIDLQLGTLTYVNAGHDPPYLTRPNSAPEMIPHTGGIALGVLPGLNYAETTIPLDPGAALYLYTDGITEAETNTGQQYGRERLEEQLAALAGKDPQELMETILSDLRGFIGDAKQFDDITCLALKFAGGEAVTDPYVPGRGDQRQASGWRRMLVQPTLETSLPRVTAFIDRFAETEGIDPAQVYSLNLALDELLTNTLQHGFPGRVEEAEITVAIRIEGETVIVRYEDNGPEFNPLEAAQQDTELTLEERPIGGLGLQLIASSFDSVSYERANGRNVTTLRQSVNPALDA